MSAPAAAVRLLSRPGCHLCEDMRAAVAPAFDRLGLALVDVDVDSDPALAARFGNEIPVLLGPEGQVIAKALDRADAIEKRLRRLVR